MTESTEPRARAQSDARIQRIWRKAYAARTRDDLRDLYREWADDYDEDHATIGFVGHVRAAEVLARHTTRHDVARVLDAGAGTGAAGEALAALGFRDLTAVDLSEEMLAKASAKGVYRATLAADVSLPIDTFAEDSFDAAILVGVFSYGQAPAETLDEILRLVRPGGVVVFTLRTDFHAENAMGVRAKMEALEEQGTWSRIEVTDEAPYLPKKDPDAKFRVWCYRVTGRPTDEVEDGFEDAVREAFEADRSVIAIDHAWIWDSTASRLYNRYTQTDGYYLTDCEEEILERYGNEIWDGEPFLVELGCGSARKIKHVLAAGVAASDGPLHYMPIDVSPGALRATVRDVGGAFGERVILAPRQGLFEDVLPEIPAGQRKLVFFFGSSIGNIASLQETVEFLRGLRAQMRPGDRLILGTDLHKDEDVLERAYNEEEACREFFVHMVRRINEYLGADFDPRVFELSSTYEVEPEYRGVVTRRVNLRVAPRTEQRTYVRELGLEAELAAGQPIQVGISRKFEPEAVRALGALAGFRVERQWFDRRRWFAQNELLLDSAP